MAYTRASATKGNSRVHGSVFNECRDSASRKRCRLDPEGITYVDFFVRERETAQPYTGMCIRYDECIFPAQNVFSHLLG